MTKAMIKIVNKIICKLYLLLTLFTKNTQKKKNNTSNFVDLDVVHYIVSNKHPRFLEDKFYPNQCIRVIYFSSKEYVLELLINKNKKHISNCLDNEIEEHNNQNSS